MIIPKNETGGVMVRPVLANDVRKRRKCFFLLHGIGIVPVIQKGEKNQGVVFSSFECYQNTLLVIVEPCKGNGNLLLDSVQFS